MPAYWCGKKIDTLFPAFRQSLSKVYARAGLCQESVILSSNRAERMLGEGALDGEWFRYSGYTDTHEILVAVPQPMFVVDMMIIWLGNKKHDMATLDLSAYKVGYKTGFRWLEQKLPTLGADPVAIPEGAPIVALMMRGRLDIFAADSAVTHVLVRALQDAGGQVHTAVIESVAFQHILHTRHHDKLARLNQAMRDAIVAGDLATVYMVPGIKPAPMHAQ